MGDHGRARSVPAGRPSLTEVRSMCVLTPTGDDRFDTKCSTCMRASPFLPGPRDEAEKRLKELTWAEAPDGTWSCPVCLTRATTNRRRFDIDRT
jgi:hypothetical protein